MFKEEELYLNELNIDRELYLKIKLQNMAIKSKNDLNILLTRYLKYTNNYILNEESIKKIKIFIYKLLITIINHENIKFKFLKKLSLSIITEELFNKYKEFDFEFLELLFFLRFNNIKINIIAKNSSIYTNHKFNIFKKSDYIFDLNEYKNIYSKYSNYNFIYYYFCNSFILYIDKILNSEDLLEDCLFRFNIFNNTIKIKYEEILTYKIKTFIKTNDYDLLKSIIKKILLIEKIYKVKFKLNFEINNKNIIKYILNNAHLNLEILTFLLKYIPNYYFNLFLKFSIKRCTRINNDIKFENYLNNYIYYIFKDYKIFEPLNDINSNLLKNSNIILLRNYYIPSTIYKVNLKENNYINEKKKFILNKMNQLKKNSSFKFLDYLSTIEIKYKNYNIKCNLYTYYILTGITNKLNLSEIKSKYKNYDINVDIKILLENKLIYQDDDQLKFNNNFSQNIDICYIPYNNKIKDKIEETDIIAFESKISKIMKIKLKLDKNALFEILYTDNINLYEIVLKNLISKDIIKVTNSLIEYIK